MISICISIIPFHIHRHKKDAVLINYKISLYLCSSVCVCSIYMSICVCVQVCMQV